MVRSLPLLSPRMAPSHQADGGHCRRDRTRHPINAAAFLSEGHPCLSIKGPADFSLLFYLSPQLFVPLIYYFRREREGENSLDSRVESTYLLSFHVKAEFQFPDSSVYNSIDFAPVPSNRTPLPDVGMLAWLRIPGASDTSTLRLRPNPGKILRAVST